MSDPVINCDFSDPVMFNGEAPTTTDQVFNFKNATCSVADPRFEEKINATTGASFKVDRTMSYGDTIIVSFLLIMLIAGIVKFFTDTIIPFFVDFKHH